MSEATWAIEAKALSKRYDDLTAVDRLDLQIAPGEVFCLLGANGAGKTTTINLLLGFHQPDSGSALIAGIDVAEDPEAARRKLAYLPESVALYGKLTGIENLRFFDRLAGFSRDSEELQSLLEAAGLPRESHDRRLASYSKGMRQKVGIAIALAKGAQALLLDEPLSGLDPSAANELGNQIERLRQDRCGVLMATHDIFRAKEVGDRIGIMVRGRLVATLASSELAAKEIETLYLQHLNESDHLVAGSPRS